jgi:hypothetical protein
LGRPHCADSKMAPHSPRPANQSAGLKTGHHNCSRAVLSAQVSRLHRRLARGTVDGFSRSRRPATNGGGIRRGLRERPLAPATPRSRSQETSRLR